MSLKDRLDAGNAEAWKPESAGEELLGKIVELSSNTTSYGTYPIVVIQPESGEPKAFHAFHTVARDQLEKGYPSIGDEIGVRYLGKVATPDGDYEGYQNYRVVIEHPAGWSPPLTRDDEQDLATNPPVASGGADDDDSIPF